MYHTFIQLRFVLPIHKWHRHWYNYMSEYLAIIWWYILLTCNSWLQDLCGQTCSLPGTSFLLWFGDKFQESLSSLSFPWDLQSDYTAWRWKNLHTCNRFSFIFLTYSNTFPFPINGIIIRGISPSRHTPMRVITFLCSNDAILLISFSRFSFSLSEDSAEQIWTHQPMHIPSCPTFASLYCSYVRAINISFKHQSIFSFGVY